ncbi:hypothetical protein F4679DRAFT_555780 [Xylaria curta]|nr:hypothetical protein F4679DRAFT_555780 [Xylaria curta]
MEAQMFPPGYAEESIAARVYGTAIAFIILNIGAVALRIGTRLHYKTAWGWDDYLIVPGLLFALGTCIIGLVEVEIAGVGRHLLPVANENFAALVHWAKSGYAIENLYALGCVFPKLSILASYLRIFTGKWYRRATWALVFIVISAALAAVVTSLAGCRPFSTRWTDFSADASKKCINYLTLWRATSVPNIVTDVVMLILPQPVVWKLHLPKQQKLAVSLVFFLGSIGIVASVLRFSVVLSVKDLSDGTYDSANIAALSIVETGAYLIAACLPILRPLVSDIAKKTSAYVRTGSTAKRHSVMHYGGERGFERMEMDVWDDDSAGKVQQGHI